MTHEELNALLTRAEDAQNIGNYEEAEKLAQQVLDNVLIADVEDRNGNILRASATRILGVIALLLSNYSIALEYLTASLKISEDYHDREGIARALGNIGSVYRNLSDYTLALDYYGKTLALAEELGNKTGVAFSLGNIGNVHHYLSDYILALDYYGKALALAEEIGNKMEVANRLGNIGSVYTNLSEYPLALDYFGKALALAEELGNKAGMASHLGNIGIVNWKISDYPLALENYFKALALDEELRNKAGVAIRLGNIGIVYSDLLDYPLALDYYGKALTLYEELGNKSGVANILGNIGTQHLKLSDYPLALDYFNKALALAEEIGYKTGMVIHLGNIGNIHQNLSDYPLALDYYRKALALAEELGNKSEVASIVGNIGGTYATPDFEGYDTATAEEFLLKAVAMNEELSTKRQNVTILYNLSDLYATTERWKESREYFEKYHTLYLEVQSEEATKQAQLIEHRRKIEESERDRQIKLARFQEQEKILHNILPAQIAERMVAGEKMIAESHDHVSVFFSDIVGFTKLSQQVTAEELVGMLNGIFSQFDQIARKHGLEKIKTIGDSYMAVAGAPIPQDNHAERAVLFALEVSEFMENYRTDSGDKVELRIGLHTGSVVAGVIGENKFSYDMWGDAVNTASRMESHGEPGKIHVSEEFMRALSLSSILSLQPYQFVERGEMEIKGKGKMKTYYLEKRSIQ